MAYTNKLMVENYLQRSLTENEEAMLAVLANAIKIWVDKTLNSTFDKVDPSTRYFDGGRSTIDIDPCTDITSIFALNDDGSQSYEYTTGTEYIAEPENERVKNEIRKRLAPFPSGLRRIAVTARFSEWDGGVPEDIQTLTTHLVCGVINAGKYASVGGNVYQEALEGHEIRYQQNSPAILGIVSTDPVVQAILQTRKELYLDTYERPNAFNPTDDSGAGLLI